MTAALGPWLDVALAAVAVGSGCSAWWAHRRAQAEAHRATRLREQLAQLEMAFQRFTAAPVVDDLLSRGAVRSGERRSVTVLFADLQGFTALADQLDPTTLVSILNGYFGTMSTAVAAHHGMVSKFMGDGLMALFGAVEHNPWQQRDAVLAALAMRDALATYNQALVAAGHAPLQFGIGIHCGEVAAGVIGSETLQEFTVIGDVVNVAARVESLTRPLATDILVTADVAQRLDTRFRCRAMAPMPIKGKHEPMPTWAVDGLAPAL